MSRFASVGFVLVLNLLTLVLTVTVAAFLREWSPLR
jgi:hypothetical protein